MKIKKFNETMITKKFSEMGDTWSAKKIRRSIQDLKI